jgi:polar amino acid transport system ATP-binding protein
LYGLNGEVEQFCEKHGLPRTTTLDLQLLVEELLQLHKPILSGAAVDLSIAYSEKNGRLELVVETDDTGFDPLRVADGDDGLAVTLVRGTAETIVQRRENGKSRLELTVSAAWPTR